jgi:hypothetical protein
MKKLNSCVVYYLCTLCTVLFYFTKLSAQGIEVDFKDFLLKTEHRITPSLIQTDSNKIIIDKKNDYLKITSVKNKKPIEFVFTVFVNADKTKLYAYGQYTNSEYNFEILPFRHTVSSYKRNSTNWESQNADSILPTIALDDFRPVNAKSPKKWIFGIIFSWY